MTNAGAMRESGAIAADSRAVRTGTRKCNPDVWAGVCWPRPNCGSWSHPTDRRRSPQSASSSRPYAWRMRSRWSRCSTMRACTSSSAGTQPTSTSSRPVTPQWWAARSNPAERWLNWVVRRRSDGGRSGRCRRRSQSPSTSVRRWLHGSSVSHGRATGSRPRPPVHWWTRLRGQGVDEVVAHIHPGHDASAAVATRAGLHRTEDQVEGEVVAADRQAPRGLKPVAWRRRVLAWTRPALSHERATSTRQPGT